MTTQIPQVPVEVLPKGTVPLENQVAGHTFQPGTNTVGMLKNEHDGTVFKPLGKPECGAREIQFYESLKNTSEPDLLILKRLVPQYKGTVKMTVNGREIDFIVLNDLTHGMHDPCIMDIKVGKRTWDPLATPEKRAVEEEKYAACKQNIGLCIPGFQVYCLGSGKLKRFGKEYGKQLNEKTFKDTLRLFLNSESGMCPTLIIQILSQLWAIQKWSRTQTSVKLYSSSLLVAYDARRLKNSLQESTKNCNNINGSIPFNLNRTPSDVNKMSQISSMFDSMPLNNEFLQNDVDCSFEEKLAEIRENYVFMWDNLANTCDESKSWALVKMIDFAHVFPSDDNSIDTNYLFGIESLVKIFEEFLKECFCI